MSVRRISSLLLFALAMLVTTIHAVAIRRQEAQGVDAVAISPVDNAVPDAAAAVDPFGAVPAQDPSAGNATTVEPETVVVQQVVVVPVPEEAPLQVAADVGADPATIVPQVVDNVAPTVDTPEPVAAPPVEPVAAEPIPVAAVVAVAPKVAEPETVAPSTAEEAAMIEAVAEQPAAVADPAVEASQPAVAAQQPAIDANALAAQQQQQAAEQAEIAKQAEEAQRLQAEAELAAKLQSIAEQAAGMQAAAMQQVAAREEKVRNNKQKTEDWLFQINLEVEDVDVVRRR